MFLDDNAFRVTQKSMRQIGSIALFSFGARRRKTTTYFFVEVLQKRETLLPVDVNSKTKVLEVG